MSGRGRAIQKYAFHLVGAWVALSTNNMYMYMYCIGSNLFKSKSIHSCKRYVPLRLDSDGIGHVTQMPNVDLSDIDPQELQAAENEYWKQKDKREKRAGEVNKINH